MTEKSPLERPQNATFEELREKRFHNRTELLELLRKIPWAEHKAGPFPSAKWKTIEVHGEGIDFKTFDNPTQLIMWLDRHQTESIRGKMTCHAALDSYLGF